MLLRLYCFYLNPNTTTTCSLLPSVKHDQSGLFKFAWWQVKIRHIGLKLSFALYAIWSLTQIRQLLYKRHVNIVLHDWVICSGLRVFMNNFVLIFYMACFSWITASLVSKMLKATCSSWMHDYANKSFRNHHISVWSFKDIRSISVYLSFNMVNMQNNVMQCTWYEGTFSWRKHEYSRKLRIKCFKM